MNYEEMQWITNDAVHLFACRWTPDDPVKACICLVHGLGEHCGRYRHWAEKLTAAGYALLSFDLRGHGQSPGKRGDAPGFDHHANDIGHLLEQGKLLYPDNPPLFLYGHSLGGLLVLYYLIQRQPELRGAVVTSPGLRTTADRNKTKVAAAKILGSIFPTLTIPNGLDIDGLSREQAVVKAYQHDPLVHDRISLRMAKAMFESIEYVFTGAPEIKNNLLLMHGSEDRITFPEGSEEIARLASGNSTLKIWEGLYHELHNEPEQDQVFEYLRLWLDEQTN